MENKNGGWLISIDGACYLICGARIMKNSGGYGYFLEVLLTNGKTADIGYGGLGPQGLQLVLETISAHMMNHPNDALDLRQHYMRGDASGSSYYGCTFAPLQRQCPAIPAHV